MTWAVVAGVDPGPVPGVVVLHIREERVYDVELAQVSADMLPRLLKMLVQPLLSMTGHERALIGVERFVTRGRANGAQSLTRDQVGVVLQVGAELDVPVVQRPAVTVKAWATDERLKKAGLKTPSGMRHAKDASRHALYAACHAGLLPDPLSSRYKKPTTKRST